MAKKILIVADVKSREEALLEEKLAEIKGEDKDVNQKLLRMFQMIQAYLPFDLVVSGSRPFNSTEFHDAGLLRIGLDEYQPIGEKELTEITRITKEELSVAVQSSSPHVDAAVYHRKTANGNNVFTPLQKVWTDFFKLESCLVFPVSLGNNQSVVYFFYSRQQDRYGTVHLALLKRLEKHFLAISRQFVADELPATAALLQAVAGQDGKANGHYGFKQIIGNHPLLLAALSLASKVACYSTSVLILGESGTGKEKIAQSIHLLSARKNSPYIKVNCATIPAALIESELFGHEKGAFTGATEKRKGKFEQAHGGTIFLDEVGELPLDLQVKLLRVLQEKEIEYVGGSSPKKVDVRIVAATNRDLENEVATGNFRLDLYYRLSVFPITLPPLRERKSDIPALALFFANRFCSEFNKTFNGFTTSMMEEMCAYEWPGNIRELENVIEQSVVLNDGDSKLELRRSLSSKVLGLLAKVNIATLEDVRHVQRETERDCIVSILQKTGGRIRGTDGAAELLNIKPTTLESKMAKLGIRREDFMSLLRNLSSFPSARPTG